jgi:hypothetical protein
LKEFESFEKHLDVSFAIGSGGHAGWDVLRLLDPQLVVDTV